MGGSSGVLLSIMFMGMPLGASLVTQPDLHLRADVGTTSGNRRRTS